MSDSVGQIGLDLVVNQNQFNRQMQGIQGIARKAGAALAAAFAVKKLINFGAVCIELGSDLQEVQNVVDVTFPSMSAKVNDFAQSAAASFGLSETMAKKFSGTFGAMAKAFGFSEGAAYEMSTALTGLAGDVASFYNISQDEAYTKLKSVFTGETESLKDLGVVMTQTALDAYALANGYGKTTAKMSEAEKVALRYKFVQQQLTTASGDFLRTSDGWANQVRVLKLQIDSFKASVGQGLINVLTPVIKVINTLVGKLVTLGNAFKSFTEMFTKKKAVGETSAGMSEMAEAADNAADSTAGIGKAATASAKKMKGALAGFDELNTLSSSAGGGSSSGSGDMGTIVPDQGAPIEDAVNETDKRFQGIINKAKELAGLFKKGFAEGLGDTSVFDNIHKSMSGIKESLKGIFTDRSVINAAEGLANSQALSFGKASGAFLSIGASIADSLTSGAAQYLQQSSDYIKERLISCFDAGSEIAAKTGELSVALASVFEVFRGDAAKQITSSIIGIFSDGFLGVQDLSFRVVSDIFRNLADPIIQNKDKIKSALDNTFQPISEVLSTLHQSVKDTFGKVFEVYEQYVKPAFDQIGDGINNGLSVVLDAYNTYVAPVLSRLSSKFTEVWTGSIQPVIDKFITFFGKLADVISILYTTVVQPFINWIIQTIVPVIMPIIETIGRVFMDVVGDITRAIGGIIDALGGIIDFIAGVFTGDWERCWDGIKGIFEGIWGFIEGAATAVWDIIGGIFTAAYQTISAIVQTIWNTIKGIFTTAINAVTSYVTTMWEMVAGVFSNGAENIRWLIDTVWTTIQSIFGNAIENVVSVFTAFWNTLKDTASAAFEAIWGIISTIWKNIKAVFESIIPILKDLVKNGFTYIKDTVNSMFTAVKNIVQNIWNNIKSFLSNAITGIYTNIYNVLNRIKTFWGNIWNGMKTTVENIFHGIWNSIKGVINSILGGVESMANGIVRGLNRAIEALNRISFDIPDWVPGLGGMKFGISIPTLPELSIPKLAQGGYVKANTPQLAMIGDNRHQGEVVAPENKLQEMATGAVRTALQASENATAEKLDQIISIMLQLVELVASGNTMEIDGKVLGKTMQRLNMEYYKTTGKPLFST